MNVCVREGGRRASEGFGIDPVFRVGNQQVPLRRRGPLLSAGWGRDGRGFGERGYTDVFAAHLKLSQDC